MNNLRLVIRQLILEKFSEQDVRNKMKGDTRDRRGIFGAHAKDLFRQESKVNPEMRKFLESLCTIHWKDMEYKGENMIEPLKNTSTKDELSCSPYRRYTNGSPMGALHFGWHTKQPKRLGIEIKGWITWLEHGDAQTGTRHSGPKNTMSGDNKQPRRTGMGRDPYKLNSMEDVIFHEKDFGKIPKKQISSFGDGEALVDNWSVVKVWYKSAEVEDIAQECADFLGTRFNKEIPIGLLE